MESKLLEDLKQEMLRIATSRYCAIARAHRIDEAKEYPIRVISSDNPRVVMFVKNEQELQKTKLFVRYNDLDLFVRYNDLDSFEILGGFDNNKSNAMIDLQLFLYKVCFVCSIKEVVNYVTLIEIIPKLNNIDLKDKSTIKALAVLEQQLLRYFYILIAYKYARFHFLPITKIVDNKDEVAEDMLSLCELLEQSYKTLKITENHWNSILYNEQERNTEIQHDMVELKLKLTLHHFALIHEHCDLARSISLFYSDGQLNDLLPIAANYSYDNVLKYMIFKEKRHLRQQIQNDESKINMNVENALKSGIHVYLTFLLETLNKLKKENVMLINKLQTKIREVEKKRSTEFLDTVSPSLWKKMIMDVEIEGYISVYPEEDYVVKIDTPENAKDNVIKDEYLTELMFLLVSDIETGGKTPIAEIPQNIPCRQDFPFEKTRWWKVYPIRAKEKPLQDCGVYPIRAFHYNLQIDLEIDEYVKSKCIHVHTFPFWNFSLQGTQMQRYDLTIKGVPIHNIIRTKQYTFPHCPGDDPNQNYTCYILTNSVFRATKRISSEIGPIIFLEYVGTDPDATKN